MMKRTQLVLMLAAAWMLGSLAPTVIALFFHDSGAPIPEPSNMALAATGAVLTALALIRRSNQQHA